MPRFIIAGQGIAGSLLAWFLFQKGEDFIVYDEGLSHGATLAAAGILNPVTGKLFAKSWMADELLHFSERTYHAMEAELGTSYYSKIKVIRVLNSVKEQNDYWARANDENFSNCFPNPGIIYLDEKQVHNPFGAFAIHNCGQVSAKNFLEKFRAFLLSKNLLKEEKFPAEAVAAKGPQVIFCDGWRARNPDHPFSYLPWQLAKGEHLFIRIPGFPDDSILKGATTISPADEKGVFYAGATYQWAFENAGPTEEKRLEILESLRKTLCCDFEIVGHGAGIRPAVKDRRPFIGRHRAQENLYIFNGFGTKGFSMAPYFADHFVKHLLERTALMDEVNVARFAGI